MGPITVTANIVPNGEHLAIFESAEVKKHSFSGRETERIHFKFKIIEGDAKGLFAFGFTTPNSKFGSKLFDFLCMLKGQLLSPNETINPESFIGRKYLIKVELSGSGKPKVNSFTLHN
jgi:hypothetical protein